MGSNTTTTQSLPTISQPIPFNQAVNPIADIYRNAGQLYSGNVGSQLWPNGANAPLDPSFFNPWQSYYNFAGGMMGGAQSPFQSGLGQVGSYGMSPQQQSILSLLSGFPGTAGNMLGAAGQNATGAFQGPGGDYWAQPQNLFSSVSQLTSQPTAASQFLGGMAQGEQNPYLQQLLNTNAERIGNLAKSASSGSGRYGSFGMYDALNRSIAATNNPLIFQSAENDRNRQLEATQQMDAARQAQEQMQLGAGSGFANLLNMAEQNRLNFANAGQNAMLGTAGAGMQGTNSLLQALQSGQGNALGWANALPSLYGLAQSPFETQLGLGAYNQNRAQNDWNLAMQQFGQGQQMPWSQLQRYAQMLTSISPLLSGVSSSGSTTTQSQPTPWTTFAGLGLAGLGALGQGGLGLFSDERAKTDIEYLGVDPDSGLKLYAYRYAADPKTYPKIVGPMAQEVAEKYPHMVGRAGDYLYIKA